MALKSTIHKTTLTLSDLDRHYYATHALMLAQHPSETLERMMVRLFAFALFASEQLGFGKGLSTDDEPALWEKDLTGAITRWIEVGLPDERILRRAAGRADEVVVLAYGGKAADVWWQQNGAALARLRNLRVLALATEDSKALGELARGALDLQCTIQDGDAWLGNADTQLHIAPLRWQPA